MVFQCSEQKKKVFVINITRNRESMGLLAEKNGEGRREKGGRKKGGHIFGRERTVTTEFFLLKPRHLTTSSEYNQLEPTANDWSAYVQ